MKVRVQKEMEFLEWTFSVAYFVLSMIPFMLEVNNLPEMKI